MSARASVSITVNFEEVGQQILAAAQLGVDRAAEELLTQAVDRAPMDQNTLRNSASVSVPLTARGGDPRADVVFDTPYAARLHEHPEYDFSTDANPNAQGKYLENAAVENRDVLRDIVGNQIRSQGDRTTG